MCLLCWAYAENMSLEYLCYSNLHVYTYTQKLSWAWLEVFQPSGATGLIIPVKISNQPELFSNHAELGPAMVWCKDDGDSSGLYYTLGRADSPIYATSAPVLKNSRPPWFCWWLTSWSQWIGKSSRVRTRSYKKEKRSKKWRFGTKIQIHEWKLQKVEQISCRMHSVM